MPKQKKIWMVAAGTGGHIFPGIYLAQAIKKLKPDQDFLFFGSAQRLEADLVPRHGFKIFFLKASPWKGSSILNRVLGLFDLAIGFFQSFLLALKERPALMISVGGYNSVPIGLTCTLLRIPFFLIEPNIHAGVANRLLSRFAKEAFASLGSDAFERFACPVNLGVPLREGLKPSEIRPEVKKILVLGGSQGARKLCDSVIEVLKRFQKKNMPLNFTVLLQSGAQNFESSKTLVKEAGLEKIVQVEAFVHHVSELLQSADLVIARAGASTLLELVYCALPTIYIPFPFAADDHQRKNALLLVKASAALMCDEKDPNFLSRLEEEMSHFLFAKDSMERRLSLHRALLEMKRPPSAEDIAKVLLSKL